MVECTGLGASLAWRDALAKTNLQVMSELKPAKWKRGRVVECTGLGASLAWRDALAKTNLQVMSELKPAKWKRGRVVECTGLENRRAARHREFESHRFRQLPPWLPRDPAIGYRLISHASENPGRNGFRLQSEYPRITQAGFFFRIHHDARFDQDGRAVC